MNLFYCARGHGIISLSVRVKIEFNPTSEPLDLWFCFLDNYFSKWFLNKYLTQILLWWGIFVASAPVLEGAEWLVILGPIFLTLLLLFVSGIPLLEVCFPCFRFYVIQFGHNFAIYWCYILMLHVWTQESADKKFGNVNAYRIYKKTTRSVILSSTFSLLK